MLAVNWEDWGEVQLVARLRVPQLEALGLELPELQLSGPMELASGQHKLLTLLKKLTLYCPI